MCTTTRTDSHAPIAAQQLTGQIQLGTPAQTLTAQFDTGSSNFWIRSSLCSDGNGCSGGPSFNIPRSTSFIAGPADQDPTSLGYGDGTAVICTYNQDVLAIAGVGVANSTLCAANAILLPPNVPNVDGLIGMGPPDRAANSTTDFDAYLRAAFTTPGVSFWFDRKATEDATGKSARAGEVTFGGANAARMSPAGFRFFPIVRDLGMWVLQLDSVTINGRNFIPTGLSKHAIIDTGSTLIILAPAIFKEVNSFMGGVESGGLYVVDCEKARTFPPVSFVFGATPFTLTWDKQIFSDGTTCVSVFAPNQDDDSVLGVAFLRHFYTTFDYGSGADGAFRVGIAQLAASDVFQSPLGNSTTGTKPTVSIPKVAPVVGPKPVAPPKVNVTRNADGGLTLNTNKKPTVTTTAVRPTVTPPKNGAAAASVMSFSALAALAASAIFVSAAF
ncbi:aspartic peptidase domain-containing protein [Entophlyctis helioformis]|nr:aspartic peptidase domain-containing protein [Entophlyctis helioformis]